MNKLLLLVAISSGAAYGMSEMEANMARQTLALKKIQVGAALLELKNKTRCPHCGDVINAYTRCNGCSAPYDEEKYQARYMQASAMINNNLAVLADLEEGFESLSTLEAFAKKRTTNTVAPAATTSNK